MRYVFVVVIIVIAIVLSSCTYNISQQQIGTHRRAAAATQAVGVSNDGVSAVQTLGTPDPPPPSTYPEYNGYPGSGGVSYDPSPGVSSFLRGLFEGVVQINIGPGYGGGDYYGGGGYRNGYVYPHHIHYYRNGPYYQRLYPYYH